MCEASDDFTRSWPIDGLTGHLPEDMQWKMLESMQKDGLEVTVAYIDVNGLKR